MRRKRILMGLALLALVGAPVIIYTANTTGGATIGPNPYAMVVDSRRGHVFTLSSGHGWQHGSVSMLDAATGLPLHRSIIGVRPVAAALDEPTERLFVAKAGPVDGQGNAINAGSISLLDARTGRVLRTVRLPGQAYAVAVEERRGHVFVITASLAMRGGAVTIRGGMVTMLDAHSGAVVHSSLVGKNPWAVVVHDQTVRLRGKPGEQYS